MELIRQGNLSTFGGSGNDALGGDTEPGGEKCPIVGTFSGAIDERQWGWRRVLGKDRVVLVGVLLLGAADDLIHRRHEARPAVAAS